MNLNEQENNLYMRLISAIGHKVVNQARVTLQRMLATSTHKPLHNTEVLLPFGGGKDSAWTLAYIRFMQLMLKQDVGHTYRLHVLIMIHPGVPKGVFKNIYNVFAALQVNKSKDIVVTTAVRGGEYIELEYGSIPEGIVASFRQEIILSGHLSQGNGRETFCNGCNFGLMNVIAQYVVQHS